MCLILIKSIKYLFPLKLLSKFICITYFIRFYYTQLCGRCLVNMTAVVKVVIHCVLILHYYKLGLSVRAIVPLTSLLVLHAYGPRFIR